MLEDDGICSPTKDGGSQAALPFPSRWMQVQYRVLFLMVLVLGVGGAFQYGFHISVMNSPSPYIKQFIKQTWIKRHGTPVPEGTLTLLWSMMVSVISIGGFIGSTASGYLIGKFGKKNCQLWNCLLPLISTVLMGLSRTVGLFEMILVGRFLCGLNAGLGMNIHAQYLGEIAPQKLRGFINTSGPVFATLGKLCGQIAGLRELFGTESLWPYILLSSGIISLVQLVTLPFFPESPSHLLLVKGDKASCEKALKLLWGDQDHQAAIDEMMKEQMSSKKGRTISVLELLRDPAHRWQLYTMIGMILSLQFSGATAIYFYAYDIFQEAGFPQDRIAYVSLGVGTFEFVSALICSLLVDRFGRKALILGGFSLMILTLGLLTVTLSLQSSYIWMPYCSVALIFTFIFLYGAGPAGAIVSTCVEIFSQAPRVPAFVISGGFGWVGLYILGMIFPYVVESMQHYCFLLFMAVIFISGILIFFIVPETKNKSIAQISQEYNKFNFRKEHKQDKAAIQNGDFSTRL
ncbi:solute carrier family 2, facilitated glucose transporter member 9-like [Rhinophrynus dorsalis]